MQKSTIKWLIIGGIALIVVISIIGAYNKLVSLNEQVDGQWAQVESVYQRRFDLIPNLVNSTKGFFKQEKDIYDRIASARTAYSGAQSVAQKVIAANQVESALGRLLAIVESNPEIKSIAAVTNLMTELAGTENRISVERMRFNNAVKEYNIKVKRFPSNLIASLFGFGEREFFQAEEGAEKAPEVNL